MLKLLIKGGYVVDPSADLEGKYDILIEGDKVSKVAKDIFEPEAKIIDAEGYIVAPGFVDLHVHFRDPGQTYKEDIESGSRCAVAGGFTTVVCMPNTNPPVDRPQVARYILSKSDCLGICNVLPAGAITEGRKGEKLADLWALKRAGCVAFTDDGSPLMNSNLMRMALELSSQMGLPIMNHCEDDTLAKGAINEGEVSAVLGISSRPPEAEDILVARDCILSLQTGGHLHVQHLSSPLSVDIIRFFKDRGAKVTCEVNPYHLVFTEKEVFSSGSYAKVNPPLRKEKDREALLEALRDGTIDCVATDHAPHADFEKGLLEEAMPGMIGLQTALPLMLKLVEEEVITLKDMACLMSTKPARILGIEAGSIKPSSTADVVIFDPKKKWILCEETSFSKSKNTPLWNKKLKGKVVCTIRAGRVVFRDGSFQV